MSSLGQESQATLALWRYNRVTGYWVHERNVTPETGKAWLEVFQRDEPAERFMIQAKKPEGKPLAN